jgi:hypothetical protein
VSGAPKICPYCKREFSPTALGVHKTACTSRKDIRAAVLQCLTDHDRPQYAVTQREYMRRRAQTKPRPPSRDALAMTFGDWAGVCAHFELVPGGNLDRVEEASPKAVARQERRLDRMLDAVDREIEDYYLRAMNSHYRRWWLLICRTTPLPDGRYAHELK